jgi:hypothetical protein
MNELSPATQVMIAVTRVYQAHGGDPPARAIAAAALRAAALYWKGEDLALYLEEIADELETQP